MKILVRADSGFCRWRLMRWRDRHGVDYLLGLARNAVLERLGVGRMQEAQAQFEATGEKTRLFGEFSYAAQTWDRVRRVIAKAEYGPQGDNPRFLVTSLTDGGELGNDPLLPGVQLRLMRHLTARLMRPLILNEARGEALAGGLWET